MIKFVTHEMPYEQVYENWIRSQEAYQQLRAAVREWRDAEDKVWEIRRYWQEGVESEVLGTRHAEFDDSLNRRNKAQQLMRALVAETEER